MSMYLKIFRNCSFTCHDCFIQHICPCAIKFSLPCYLMKIPRIKLSTWKYSLSYSQYQKFRCIQKNNFSFANLFFLIPLSSKVKNVEGSENKLSNFTGSKEHSEAIIKVVPKKQERKKIDHAFPSLERNFITAVRAMSEFLLKPSDLEDLRQTKRRSPFENEPPITVYWRKDIEAKTLQIWGSKEALEKEKSKRRHELQLYKHYAYAMKNVLDKIKKADSSNSDTAQTKESSDTSEKVVWSAVFMYKQIFVLFHISNKLFSRNGINFFMKLGAWAYTGSHSLFAEALHSLADVTNQADIEHPYGYTNMRYVSSLISGAMIFCIGAGLSVQHGISGLLDPVEVTPLYWAFFVLGGSLITEGGTLIMAVHTIRKGAKKQQMPFWEYVYRGQDPAINVVLLEDMAAVMGVGIALSCMGLTSYLGTHIPDAIGSCLIGTLLAGVSGFLIFSNTAALVGKSIPEEVLDRINEELERDVMIRAVHDVKGIEMGSGLVRYKAEVDFDGRQLTKAYIDKQDIELVYQKRHPEVRHCDLEIL